MKIVAVDDEPMMLEELVEAIREARPDAELTSYTNPLEMLKEAEGGNYDVTFLDIEMPGVNGIEAAKQLKIMNPGINLVFVTGYSEYAKDAFSVRASGYVLKPATEEQIRQELDNLRSDVSAAETGKLDVHCFGEFDVFVNGEPLKFERSKTKEMLAYLIECRGSGVTASRLSEVLWENEGSNL